MIVTGQHVMTAQAIPSGFPKYTYRHYHDIELTRLRVKDKNGDPWQVRNPNELPGTPEVYVLYDYSVILTQQWQYYIYAMNREGMASHNISALLNTNKAFCNHMGHPGRANWILGEYLDNEDPRYSKVYTCGGGLVSGIPEGEYLRVSIMSGAEWPPLKLGRHYPGRLEDVRLDDYLWNPREHPWFFIPAVNITDNGYPFPFAAGGVYPWTPEPTRPFSFLPLASRRAILYPLSHLQRVSRWVSPYAVVI